MAVVPSPLETGSPAPLQEAPMQTNDTLATVTPIHPDFVDAARRVVESHEVGEHEVGAEELAVEALRAEVKSEMQKLTNRFNESIADEPEAERPISARDLNLELKQLDPAEFKTDTGWAPARVFMYSSNDPYREHNPGLAEAGSDLIQGVVELTEAIRESDVQDATLTYLDSQRAKQGKKATVVTQELMDADPAIGDWIVHLPDAERLRPVAHPAMDGVTVILEEGEFKEIPKSKALSALVGGSGDGRAVIEREAWQAMVGLERITEESTKDGKLVVTSLGTGTGEPAMDTGIAIMKERFGEDFEIALNGFDINPDSLEVAKQMAVRKTQETDTTGHVTFNGEVVNLLSEEGIEEAVAGTNARWYESTGFSEYVPSDHSTKPEEQKQREFMKRLDCLSAEEFYGTVYKHMPEGSDWATGNMRDDSPEASFVVDGLGWKGIIQRSAPVYLKILERSGIPAEAVTFYVPDPENSAGVYNLVVVHKS